MLTLKNKLSAEQRVELVHVSLMRSKDFALFSGLFMVGKTTISDNPFVTAYTNGRDAAYGRGFVDMLTDKELAFLVMHENMHKCYRHLTTWKKLHDINHRLANIACDYVINIQLVDMDKNESMIAMPRDKKTGKIMGVIDERFRGMDAKQVFDILLEECEGDDAGGDDGEGGEGTATDGNSPSDGGNNPERKGKSHGGLDVHDWDEATDGMSEDEKKELEREIQQALRQGGIYAGKVGANVPREIGELLKPKINWREVLRRFVRTSLKDRDSVSWRRAHRNFLWQDVILPSILGKRMKHLVIAMDTSGSIQGKLLTAFLSEMNQIVKDVGADRVDVIYWDAHVAGHEIYTGVIQDIVHRTKPKGGGGTDPDVVVQYMNEKGLTPDALVILSDGYMHTNKPAWAGMKNPTLWCILGNENYEVPCGQKLVIKED
jgi:predicted metal-dependent peptidase